MPNITSQLKNCIDTINEETLELFDNPYPVEVKYAVRTALRHLENALEILVADYNYPS